MSVSTEKTWGVVNPRRGNNYENEARQFINDFPIGTTLSNDSFDKWAHRHGYLNVPFGIEDKQSDVWLAHLTRRNQLRKNIFKASTNISRMGDNCFVLSSPKGAAGGMIVETPQVALEKTKFAEKLEKLVITKRRKLGYLMQSLDFAELPPHQKALAENLYDELSGWNQVIQLQTQLFDGRMSKLIRQIREDVRLGVVVPKNHAIGNFLLENDQGDDTPDFFA